MLKVNAKSCSDVVSKITNRWPSSSTITCRLRTTWCQTDVIPTTCYRQRSVRGLFREFFATFQKRDFLLFLLTYGKRRRPDCLELTPLRDPAVESERFRRDLKTHLLPDTSDISAFRSVTVSRNRAIQIDIYTTLLYSHSDHNFADWVNRTVDICKISRFTSQRVNKARRRYAYTSTLFKACSLIYRGIQTEI